MIDVVGGIIISVMMVIFAVCFSVGVESLGESFKDMVGRK